MVKNVWVARRPPGFAFVEMDDRRDAQEAARSLDGARIAGSRLVETVPVGTYRTYVLCSYHLAELQYGTYLPTVPYPVTIKF